MDKTKHHKSIILVIITCVIVFTSHIMSDLWAIFACASLLYIVCIIYAYNITRYIGNYIILFIIFHVLYGLAGPLNDMLGLGLPTRFGVTESAPSSFVRQQILSIGSFICVISVLGMYIKPSCVRAPIAIVSGRILFRMAVLLALIATVFYVINAYRIGGIAAVFSGKAAFQSDLGSISFTLPHHIVANISFAMMTSYIIGGYSISKFRDISIYILSISVVLFSYVILGQRGPMLGWLVMIFVVYYSYNVYRFKVSHIWMGITVYAVLSLSFAIRSVLPYAVSTGDIEAIWRIGLREENIIRSINPGTNEFGAAYGNYSAFVNDKNIEYPQYGLTYIEALAVPIPGFIYPGEKPKQITYEFRDSYFPMFGDAGRIAGSGFSSILEAYINFGRLGSVIVYGVIGILIVLIEHKKKRLGMLGMVNYVSMSPLLQSFHRSAWGLVLGNVFWLLVMNIAVCWIVKRYGRAGGQRAG